MNGGSTSGQGTNARILRCDHIHLIAEDIDRTVEWYGRVLGARVTFEGQFRGSRVKYLDMGGMTFIVFGRLGNEPVPRTSSVEPRYGVDHFGFAVEDLTRTLREMESAGVRILEGPVEVRPGLRIAYIEGPDRIRIELSERRS